MRAIPQDDISLSDGNWYDEQRIPDGSREVVIYSDYDIRAVWNRATADPASTGARLTAGVTHKLDCRGSKWMHLKRVPASTTTVEITYLIG